MYCKCLTFLTCWTSPQQSRCLMFFQSKRKEGEGLCQFHMFQVIHKGKQGLLLLLSVSQPWTWGPKPGNMNNILWFEVI